MLLWPKAGLRAGRSHSQAFLLGSAAPDSLLSDIIEMNPATEVSFPDTPLQCKTFLKTHFGRKSF